MSRIRERQIEDAEALLRYMRATRDQHRANDYPVTARRWSAAMRRQRLRLWRLRRGPARLIRGAVGVGLLAVWAGLCVTFLVMWLG